MAYDMAKYGVKGIEAHYPSEETKLKNNAITYY
jgi:hypothetical protein